MALGSTQPLTEVSTRSISWGKGGRCVRLTTYHHPVPLSRNLGTLTSWNLLGPSGPVTGLNYLYIDIHNSQFITSTSISCVCSYMFRLIYRAIFRLAFSMVCMYSCWCFESYEISYYK